MYCAQVVQGEGFTIFLRKPVDDQIYLTVQTGGIPQRLDHLVTSIYQSIDDILQDAKACVVHERIFGSNTCQHSILESRNRSLSKCCGDTGSGLFTFIEGKPVWGEGLAGIQVLAVSPRTSTEKVQVIYEKGAAVGRIWRRHGNTFVMLQNLHGQLSNSPAEDSRTAEVGRMFERTERLLKQVHGDYRDVVRTWLYLSEILKWYPQFNEVRNSAYARFGIMPSTTDHEPVHRLTLPASTGIQAENPLGAACLMDVLAIVGQSRPPVVQMSNSRQKDAFRYRSAFSRGACIEHPDFREIQISGTAAIDEAGHSLYPGDFRKQVVRTFDNVEALLAQGAATLQDFCSGTAFIKRVGDSEEYGNILEELDLKSLPCVWVAADICRDDLLFEIDGIAAVAK